MPDLSERKLPSVDSDLKLNIQGMVETRLGCLQNPKQHHIYTPCLVPYIGCGSKRRSQCSHPTSAPHRAWEDETLINHPQRDALCVHGRSRSVRLFGERMPKNLTKILISTRSISYRSRTEYIFFTKRRLSSGDGGFHGTTYGDHKDVFGRIRPKLSRLTNLNPG